VFILPVHEDYQAGSS